MKSKIKLWVLLTLLAITISFAVTRPGKWTKMMSSTYPNGKLVQLLPFYALDDENLGSYPTSSGIVVAYDSGNIFTFDVLMSRTEELHTTYVANSLPFTANITAFSFLTDLDIYYAGLQDGSIWQLEIDYATPEHNDPTFLGKEWSLVYTSNVTTNPPGFITFLLPFMKGAFFDLYFGLSSGPVLEYNTFYNFGHTIYGGISSMAPIQALYTDRRENGTLVKSLLTGYGNGAIIQTIVGPNGNPTTQVIRAVGWKIVKFLLHRTFALSSQNVTSPSQVLITGENYGAMLGAIRIYLITTGALIYSYPYLPAPIGDLALASNWLSETDSLIIGLTDGSIYELKLTNISGQTLPYQLAGPELFGGFPVTCLTMNWVNDTTSSTTALAGPIRVLLASTYYGTIAALFANDTEWQFVASPSDWESPQHILDMNFIPTESNSTMHSLIATLDGGEVAALKSSHWNFVRLTPSLAKTRSRIVNSISIQDVLQNIVNQEGMNGTTGTLSSSQLETLVYIQSPVVLYFVCQSGPCSTTNLTMILLGFEGNSHLWRKDGENIIVYNTVTENQESVYYDDLFNYTLEASAFAWTSTFINS